MAISTLDGVIAGMQYPREFIKAVTGTLVAGRPMSLLYLNGVPGPAVVPSIGIKGGALTTYPGQIPFTNPVSGNSYLARFSAQATQSGMLVLADRLWHNNLAANTANAQIIGNTISSSSVANPTVITCSANHPFADGDVVVISGHTGSTPAIDGQYTISNCGADNFTIPVDVSVGGAGGTVGIALPARDSAGSINGDGVLLGVEVLTQTSTNAPTITLTYTNSLGVGAKTGVNISATAATSIVGTFHPIGLAAGDVGVRSIQALQLSVTWTAGTLAVVAYRILARLPLIAQTPNAIDALTGGFPRMFDNTVPFLFFIPNTTTTSDILGNVIWAQG